MINNTTLNTLQSKMNIFDKNIKLLLIDEDTSLIALYRNKIYQTNIRTLNSSDNNYILNSNINIIEKLINIIKNDQFYLRSNKLRTILKKNKNI